MVPHLKKKTFYVRFFNKTLYLFLIYVLSCPPPPSAKNFFLKIAGNWFWQFFFSTIFGHFFRQIFQETCYRLWVFQLTINTLILIFGYVVLNKIYKNFQRLQKKWKKDILFLSGQPLPPPLLVYCPLKSTFFCGFSTSIYQVKRDNPNHGIFWIK